MSRPTSRDHAARLTPWLVLLHDLAWAAAVMATTLAVRYRFERKPLPDHLLSHTTLWFVAVCAVVFIAFRQHRTMWRFTALNEVVKIAQAVVVANLILLPILFSLDRAQDLPRSTPLIVAPVLTAALAFGRLLAHALAHGDIGAPFRFQDRSRPPAVAVGSAKALSAYLTSRRRNAAQRIAGLVTLDGAPFGRTIHGVEVLGDMRRLTSILKAVGAAEDREPQVVLTEPRPGRELMEAVVAAAGESGARVVRVRGERSGGGTVAVDAADLLDRPPRTLDPERARSLIRGKRVLVTGAGGTIGAELTRQALKLEPERVILLDASEYNLYAIDQALREEGYPDIWTVELGDVRDVPRLEELFNREQPQVVLHAAALKHVPLMELNPAEAVLTNLGGALNVARLAKDRCEALVLISTDKAVNPTNVMGATKRAAERAVRAATRGGMVRTAIVRFGNVLGSTGSVAPLFERQIARGGPITVTHPEMERFFMTVQEASRLVLQAASLPTPGGGDDGDGGGVYVLDMGEPVKIDHLARQMIQLHGLQPDEDIEIVYTGLRPGEKLFEEIFYEAEAVHPTQVDGVLSAYDPAPTWEAVADQVERLLGAAVARDEDRVVAALQALEPAFQRA